MRKSFFASLLVAVIAMNSAEAITIQQPVFEDDAIETVATNEPMTLSQTSTEVEAQAQFLNILKIVMGMLGPGVGYNAGNKDDMRAKLKVG